MNCCSFSSFVVDLSIEACTLHVNTSAPPWYIEDTKGNIKPTAAASNLLPLQPLVLLGS
jgi:hypothetical protein